MLFVTAPMNQLVILNKQKIQARKLLNNTSEFPKNKSAILGHKGVDLWLAQEIIKDCNIELFN